MNLIYNMPKILTVLNRLNVGGPSYIVAFLAKYLNPNYESHILAGYKEPNEGNSEYIMQDMGLSYEYVPNMFRSINFSKDKEAYRFIKKAITQYKPDIVHTHAAKAGALGRFAAYYSKEKPKAIVHTYHGNVFDGYFSPIKTKVILSIERFLAKRSDAIIAISDQQKDDLVNRFKIAPANKIHVIRLGFDLEKFADNTAEKRRKFRSYYNITDDVSVITITGRLTPIKNHQLFISAVKILKQSSPELKFKAFIVGDGELMDDIISQIKEAALSYCNPQGDNFDADIIFTSWRKDIDVINAGSDIAALTSLNEGTPVSIIEALASQKAVVSTNVGGVKDVIVDGINGILSDQLPESFASNLKKLITDKEFRLKIALNGQKYAFENFTYHRLIKETEILYKKLLQNV